MCALVWAFAKERGIEVKLANNGDDCVVMMERSDEGRFMHELDSWFLHKGFRMVAEAPVYNLCEIEFCQMHPIEMDDGTCMMVRNIPVALRKDTLSSLDLSSRTALLSWFTAVGLGGMALTGGIPIIQNLYRTFIRLGCGKTSKISEEIHRNSGMWLMSNNMDKEFAEPSANVRMQVFLAWGILPDEQEVLEKHLDEYEFDHTISAVDSHINHQLVFHALSR
jgi:hypothetical protein